MNSARPQQGLLIVNNSLRSARLLELLATGAKQLETAECSNKVLLFC